MEIDVSKSLDSYTVAIQQMVAIASALYISSTKILILDEPTSSLDVNETNQLFKVMAKLKNEGVGIIFITHFIGQIFRNFRSDHCIAERKTRWYIRYF